MKKSDRDVKITVGAEGETAAPSLSKNSARILGAAVLILAAVGIISIVMCAASALSNRDNKHNAEEIARLEEYITPVAAVGIGEFSDVSDIGNSMLLRSAAVCAIRSNGEPNIGDDGRVRISADAINGCVKKLFGDSAAVKMTSFDINGLLFEYDSKDSCYCFFASGHAERFAPKVKKYSHSGDIITAKVEYQPCDGEEDGGMYEYKIKKSDENMTILSVKKSEK